MLNKFAEIISNQLSLSYNRVLNVLKLLEEGATIPFIARYRKEMTGSMDEQNINDIDEKFNMLKDLVKRKEFILKSIEDQGELTEDLKNKIQNSYDPVEIEDLYMPFKRSNKTKAAKAREKGLEPLANYIFEQKNHDISSYANKFLNDKVPTVEDAIQGAKDIIAELISENKDIRDLVRFSFDKYAFLESKVVKTKIEEAQKYKDYFDYSERLNRIPSHRLLAVLRGESEKYLRLKFTLDEEILFDKMQRKIIHRNSPVRKILEETLEDSYDRLIKPGIETEMRAKYKEIADREAIEVFEENLKQLLLAPPVGQKRTLAIDPGFRTGCKVVCLDKNGDLLDEGVIYPHPPHNKSIKAESIIWDFIEKYDIKIIAIGEGTAGRETMNWLQALKLDENIKLFYVNEDGASIYSASKIAREEFPDKDITVRGAVSIGRRLMDPLAELVKIDPKSIGVGQYQHDVNQKLLKDKLDRTVVSAVNTVGVNLNTASEHLLAYVSGLGPVLAKNIVKFRSEKGAFDNRNQLKKVPRLGNKAFEQSAGFLRIRNGKNPLDNTAVHPEHYDIVKKMTSELNVDIDELKGNKDLLEKIDLNKYVTNDTGIPTLKDIIKELEKPGLDPRGEASVFAFDERVKTIDDLENGMILKGKITNITNFGAFVNIGIKENGLVHLSQMADKFVKDPKEIVSLNQEVSVKVLSVDKDRKRVQLSMKGV